MKVVYRGREWELPGGMTVRDAILKVGMSVHAVLAVRDGKLISEEELLKEDDSVKLIAVVSGG